MNDLPIMSKPVTTAGNLFISTWRVHWLLKDIDNRVVPKSSNMRRKRYKLNNHFSQTKTLNVSAGQGWPFVGAASSVFVFVLLFRDETRSLKLNFGVSVSTGQCPDPPENISVPQGVRGGLPCKQKEIFRLNKTRSIRWMKVWTSNVCFSCFM